MSKKNITIIFSLLLIFFFIGCSNEDKTGSFDDGNDYWEGSDGPPPWLDTNGGNGWDNGGNNSTPLTPLEPATPIPMDTDIEIHKGIWYYSSLDDDGNVTYYYIMIAKEGGGYNNKYYYVYSGYYNDIQKAINMSKNWISGTLIDVVSNYGGKIKKENDAYIMDIMIGKTKEYAAKERCEFRFDSEKGSGTISTPTKTIKINKSRYKILEEIRGVNELLMGKWYRYDERSNSEGKSYININEDGSINLNDIVSFGSPPNPKTLFYASEIKNEKPFQESDRNYTMLYEKDGYVFKYAILDFKYNKKNKNRIELRLHVSRSTKIGGETVGIAMNYYFLKEIN